MIYFLCILTWKYIYITNIGSKKQLSDGSDKLVIHLKCTKVGKARATTNFFFLCLAETFFCRSTHPEQASKWWFDLLYKFLSNVFGVWPRLASWLNTYLEHEFQKKKYQSQNSTQHFESSCTFLALLGLPFSPPGLRRLNTRPPAASIPRVAKISQNI